MRKVKPLGKDIGPLVLRRHHDEPHLVVLDHLVGEVFPDVDVLGSLTAADDVVAPFNTRRVVLVGFLCPNPSRRRRSLRYKTSQPAADAE